MNDCGLVWVRRFKWSATFATVVALWVVHGVGVAVVVGAEVDEVAKRGLRGTGLTPLNGVWVLREEVLLRRRLPQLERLRQEMLTMRRALLTARNDNNVRWSQIASQVETLEKRIKGLPTDSKDRRKLDAQLKKLLQTAVPPGELAGAPNVRTVLKQLVAKELDTIVYAHWSSRTLEQIRDRYPMLQADRATLRRLAALNAILGSPKPYRDADDSIAASLEHIDVPGSWLYREAGQWRFGAVLNDRFPATLTYSTEQKHLLLAASLAQSLGASRDSQRRPERIVIGKRAFQAVPIIVKSLRIGSHVGKDIAAWQLPPEAADVGSICGRNAAPEWELQLQPANLRVVVRAR